ncbi:hypothetical protein AAB109_28370 (plasmid) [Priestia megaterium]|nr:hypothetical protein [Priestia megaterium]
METQSIQLTNETMAYIDKGQGTPIVPLAYFYPYQSFSNTYIH